MTDGFRSKSALPAGPVARFSFPFFVGKQKAHAENSRVCSL
jgi:hypothetical protein